MPALTCADVPSGATSVSRTTAVATGASTARWRTTSGHAQDRERLRQRLGRVGRAEGLVGPEVAREAVRAAAGAPRQRGRASRPSAGGGTCRRPARRRGDRASDEPAGQRQPRPPSSRQERPLDVAGMRERRRRPPPTRPRRRERLGLGVVALEPDDRRLVVAAVRARRCRQRSKNRTISWSSSRFGPGWRRCGQPWTQLPTSVRVGAVQRACIRNAGSTYESHQPPMLRIAAVDRVVVGRERALPPVRAVGLLAEPVEQPRRRRLEPRQPLVEPARRRGTPRPAASRSSPTWLTAYCDSSLDRHAAAAVVDVVEVAVVGAP